MKMILFLIEIRVKKTIKLYDNKIFIMTYWRKFRIRNILKYPHNKIFDINKV